jgi:HD-GYP domain-containing protein (c-di-GMP phosphodiesterase class II)
MVRVKRGNLPSDIATATSRWSIITLLGATILHLPLSTDTFQVPLLFIAAVAMFLGDIVTITLEIAPMSGESPLRVVGVAARESGVAEGMQYLLGILGALLALHYPWALLLLLLPLGFVYRALKHVLEVQNSTLHILESMADTVDLRDPYTGGHSRRVATLCASILGELNLRGLEADLIIAAARVHDIGKIAIPDQILNKPGRLTSDELAIMRSHSERGAALLLRYPDFARGAAIVRHHHESWDGTGYPSGLKGQNIPYGARVIAVADSFDAMTSDRPYRPGMSIHQAVHILQTGRGQQWDPEIVDAFLRYLANHAEQPLLPQSQSSVGVIQAQTA